MGARDEEDEKAVPAAEPIVPEGLVGRADPVPQRPPGALQRLRTRLARGGGARGARLAELALRAGITVPPREAEMHGAGSLEAALWMELVRENATLRHAADKLAERQEILSRRIRRTKERLQALRLKVIQRRTGLTAKDLVEMPSPPQWQDLIEGRRPAGGAPGNRRISDAKSKPAEASGETSGAGDEEGKATEPE